VTRGGLGQRAAVFIDLENLVHDERQRMDWTGAERVVRALIPDVSTRAQVVLCIAVCDGRLARRLALPLADHGVRTYTHRGGPDAADWELQRRLDRDIPASCSLVVIASGDHFFAAQAARLRGSGKRVEVAARNGCISAELYVQANDFCDLTVAVSSAA